MSLEYISFWSWCRVQTLFWSTTCLILGLSNLPVYGQGGGHSVTFEDIAASSSSGLEYERVASATEATAELIKARGTISMNDLIGFYPIKPRGVPGVALLDFDRDSDLDIYVTNGPGVANSLFANQLADNGRLEFVDVASSASAALSDQDSSGVCFGDIDNDGDADLYVLGRSENNRLLENLGNGSFSDITISSGAGGGTFSSMSCSMGDVDGDGLLDIAVANNFDMATNAAIFIEPFALNEVNHLFLNQGGNSFVEVGASAGLQNVQEITWAIAMADVDQDGAIDIITASDNAGIPFASMGGVDRGFVRYYRNDGAGNFSDVTSQSQLLVPGDWMGISFADFNSDGTLDIFASNTGDFFEPFLGIPASLGEQASRWFLQNSNGTFSDPGVGDTVASPFGWGTAAFDYDLDGDTDLLYYGGLDAGPIIELSNPGTLLQNDGSANFSFDGEALAGGAEHLTRVEHGVAVGDLDGNGAPDVVSVSNFDIGPSQPVEPFPYPFNYGSVFDGVALVFPTFLPGALPGELIFSGAEFPNGSLAVELNSGNSNRWVKIDTLGTVGLTTGGRSNRDGIGAVVKFTPRRGNPVLAPVLGGSSYASQHSLTQIFGLKRERRGTVEVLWPGGVRNRLYKVRASEHIEFPEIPCSFDDPSLSFGPYVGCVLGALSELRQEGVLSHSGWGRFLSSAILAYFDH